MGPDSGPAYTENNARGAEIRDFFKGEEWDLRVFGLVGHKRAGRLGPLFKPALDCGGAVRIPIKPGGGDIGHFFKVDGGDRVGIRLPQADKMAQARHDLRAPAPPVKDSVMPGL